MLTTSNGNPLASDLLNTPVEIRAEVISQMLMERINEGFISDGLARDVTGFGDGATLFIPLIGDLEIFDYVEDGDITLSAIGTDKLSLKITEYKGTGLSISDKLKSDSWMIANIQTVKFHEKALFKINEQFEKDLFGLHASQVAATAIWSGSVIGDQATPGDACVINGVPHRYVAGGVNNVMTIADIAKAKNALDTALAPAMGRSAFLDNSVELEFNLNVADQAFTAVSPYADKLSTGFKEGQEVYGRIFGFDLYTSSRVATALEEVAYTFDDIKAGGVNTDIDVAGYAANLFACLADDETKPFMSAWRERPMVEGERKPGKKTDYMYASARWGVGIQRADMMVTIRSAK
jgi:hypothetical protein